MTKKIRLWDNQLLSDTYVKATQIHFHIEQLIAHLPGKLLGELPHSMVPTDVLYELVMCNEFMYELLIDKELLEAGGKKHDMSRIH
jgi:hypothetical protein